MPLILVWLLVQVQYHVPTAILVGACLCVSVLLHEIGHVWAARSLGLRSDEILLWPLGGLAAVESTSIPKVDFLVAAAGPLVNLVICTITLPVIALYGSTWPGILNPTAGIPVDPVVLADRGFRAAEVCEVIFAINWVLLLANLLPALPLDGGRMLRAVLAGRHSPSAAQEWAFRVAVGAGVIVSLVAMLFLKSTMLMGLGTFILLGAIFESMQMKLGERQDDSYMGYDFSQG
ncbi:MAG: site-2 protease family protein, partial [Planctomycetota bacterium]|nr:site-2 protease family protein [Planctomycetota bacterium]